MNSNANGSQNVVVNVNVANTVPTLVVRSQPGCLVQFLYFVFIGWWLGGLAISLAYLLFLTVIGIPLGVMIINNVPYLMALRRTEPAIAYLGSQTQQHNFFVRALWFICVGWWATSIWLSVAYLLCCTIIGMPVGFLMFDKAPSLLTLHRN